MSGLRATYQKIRTYLGQPKQILRPRLYVILLAALALLPVYAWSNAHLAAEGQNTSASTTPPNKSIQDQPGAPTSATSPVSQDPSSASNFSDTSLDMTTDTTASDQSTSEPHNEVTINGQSVTLPASGSITKHITTPDGTTSVHVSITGDNADSANNHSSSSTHLHISSNSTSNSEVDSSP